MRTAVVTFVLLMTAACSGSAEETVTESAPEEIAQIRGFAVDRIVTMKPGAGPGERAARILEDGFGPGVSNADHIGTVDTARGQVHIIAFRMKDNMLPGGFSFCVGEISQGKGGAGCGSEPITEPEAGGVTTMDGPGGYNSITAFGGPDASFAILTTEKDATLGINTARGWAYAEWPIAWGMPATITFYDDEGTEVFSSDYGPF